MIFLRETLVIQPANLLLVCVFCGWKSHVSEATSQSGIHVELLPYLNGFVRSYKVIRSRSQFTSGGARVRPLTSSMKQKNKQQKTITSIAHSIRSNAVAYMPQLCPSTSWTPRLKSPLGSVFFRFAGVSNTTATQGHAARSSNQRGSTSHFIVLRVS